MKKFLSCFLLLSFSFLSFTLNGCSSLESKSSETSTALSEEKHSKTELQKFLDSKGSKRVAVIKFYADWCGTCRDYQPQYTAAKASLEDANVDFYEVNVDQKEYSALIKELKIGLIPITYFVSQDKKSIENRVGYISSGQLAEKVQSLTLK
ncbi:MAG: thioredoxin family protein [bacterium]